MSNQQGEGPDDEGETGNPPPIAPGSLGGPAMPPPVRSGPLPTSPIPSYDRYPPAEQPHHHLEPYPEAPAAVPPRPPAYPPADGYPGPYAGVAQVVGRPPVSTAILVLAWVVAAITFLYLLPWAIAVTRNRSNMVGIFLVNLLLGWSFIGWVISLVMACGSESQQTVVVNNYQAPGYPPPGR